MDSQSSYKAFFSSEAEVSNVSTKVSIFQRLPLYTACAALGLLGGAVGVALVIGLAILIQLRLPPPSIFAPGVIPIMLVAVLAGLGISWLLAQVAKRIWRGPFSSSHDSGLQVILVFSVFASLLQTLIFFAKV
jgi:hypothetical protein